MTTAKTIWNTIQHAQKVVITAHKSPDGDSVGSSLALFHFLKKFNKEVVVIHPDATPDFLHWVPGQSEILVFEYNSKKAADLMMNADVLFSLDYNHPNRVGDEMQIALEASPAMKVMIDHHLNPADFCQYVISRPEVCSTAQLVYEWISDIDQKNEMDATIGTCIYLGIMTDTGSFRFPSVEPRTHEIAAELLTIGVKHSMIHESTYDTNSLNRIRLVGYCMSEKLVCLNNIPVAYASLTAAELEKFNAQKGDTEGIVNQILGIKGMRMAVFFAEKDGKIKISFRSKGEYVVNELAAQHFNGGGHAYASGGASSDDMNTTIDKFVTKVKDFIPVS